MTPLLVHGQSEPRAMATLSRAGERSRSTRQLRQRQGQRHKEQEGEVDSPGKTLAGRSLRSPGKSLARATCPMPAERATLEPRGSNAINHIGTKAREAPPWWHADLREDHEHTRLDEDQKTTILGGILAEEIHETPDKTLAEDDHVPRRDPCRGPRQGPCQRHLRGRGQARACQGSTAVPMQLPAQPAEQAPAWRRAASTTHPANTCMVACRSS